jgi:hypothetical protein
MPHDRREWRSHIQVLPFNLSFFHDSSLVRGWCAVKGVVLKRPPTLTLILSLRERK